MYQDNLSIKNKLEFLKNLNFNNILDGTQKTLNIVNQAIPLIYQVKPLIGNMKTLMNLTKIINEPDKSSTPIETKKELKTNPIFYI